MTADASTRKIVLLRGINVGGHAKLPMAQLREICSSLGCTNVSTYIQSGNVLLDTELSDASLASRLEEAIGEGVGFTPRVVVRAPDEVAAALDANPYPDTPDRFLHIGFLDKAPSAASLRAVEDIDVSPEGFTVKGREIYLNYIEGAGKSKKLARVAFERKLDVAVTARNLRTVQKLVDLAGS
jgi:uncharacterized protein (DUF1697 family)